VLTENPSSRIAQAVHWSEISGEIPVFQLLKTFSSIVREYSAHVCAQELEHDERVRIKALFEGLALMIEKEL
jgi:hypothetical protein